MEYDKDLTTMQYKEVITQCRSLFEMKLSDYGAAWRILRPESLTDQIYIKAMRIRNLETKGAARVQEGIQPEFVGIVNYAIIGQIQLALGFSDIVDISAEQALAHYDAIAEKTFRLMMDKNHDYDEVWRGMRISSFTDLILTKVLRTKNIESQRGATIVSEGVEANYMDMVNYAIFALIRLSE
ncbi:DUF1599 domain-containing protein [Porphyromonas gingivicanis]|nr:DUF1599 domain-containing protein [Porphyromonas gingivicanis]